MEPDLTSEALSTGPTQKEMKILSGLGLISLLGLCINNKNSSKAHAFRKIQKFNSNIVQFVKDKIWIDIYIILKGKVGGLTTTCYRIIVQQLWFFNFSGQFFG